MTRFLLCVCLALIAGTALAQGGFVLKLNPAEWQRQQLAAFEKSERIFTEAQKRNGLIAQYEFMVHEYNADTSAPFHVLFSQYLSWIQTYIGEYSAARRTYAIRQVAERGDAPSPLHGNRYRQVLAMDAIARLAKGRRAVFFNEAHNIVQTRVLTVRMLKRLRDQGFNTFAAETLYESDKDLNQRGYPTVESGFYIDEPVYAEMVRTALALGYRVIAYEAVANPRGDAREREQAKHLYDRVFRDNPDARLVLNAGYAHIQETGKYLDGRSMAYYFHKLTDIDPLTVEQTMMIEHDTIAHDHPIYRAVVTATHPTEATLYLDEAGKPWSLKPDYYDMSVFLPPDVDFKGRPNWLTLGDLRTPYAVDTGICGGNFPCLLEPRPVDEGQDAIPSDRLLLVHAEPIKAARVHNLYLRPGKYVMTVTSRDNRVITRNRINVSTTPAVSP